MLLSSQREFAGDPVVRTPRFHFRGHGFNPWLGKSNPTSFAMQPEGKFAKVCTVLQPASWTTDSQKRKGGREEGRKEGRKEGKGRKRKERVPSPPKKKHKRKALVKVKFANFCGVPAPIVANSSHQHDVIECELVKRHDNWLYYYVYYCFICCWFIGMHFGYFMQ